MRIERLEPDIDLYRGYCDELERVIDGKSYPGRPCSNCDIPCTAHKSPVCACACAPDCVHAPKEMSSDGDLFPIEQKIAPLVYAFHQLRECQPCWSCEGHEASAGAPMRLPRVIFYARSNIYPALIAEAASKLLFQKNISVPWDVVITPVDNKLDATYTLQPNISQIDGVRLDQLQSDALIIAENLQDGVIKAALMYRSKLSASLNSRETV